jgi:hypothetical protein
LVALDARAAKLRAFHDRLVEAGLGTSYEASHAQLALDAVRAMHKRYELLAAGELHRLPEAASAAAADQSYEDAATKLMAGLDTVIKGYEKSADPCRQRIFELYMASH